jgi:glycosyltransferase involved in cell wall biosynthesis
LDIDSGIGWIRAAERACSHLTPGDVDVILATGSPFAAFSLAKRISGRLGRPYVLDYRDPWTGNPYKLGRPRASVYRKQARLLEACAAVTVVSRSWASAIEMHYALGERVHVITNGFDAEELSAVPPLDFGHSAIVYTGRFYPPKRVVAPIMAALRRLLLSRCIQEDWKFHYFGSQGNYVSEEAMRFGVMDRVRVHGNVSRAEALSAVRGAALAVVVSSVAEDAVTEDRGMVPAKIYEIIGLGRPMIVIAPPGSDVASVAETCGCSGRFTASDVDGIASYLANSLKERAPDRSNGGAYSWSTIGRRLDSVLRDVADRRASCPRLEEGSPR